MVKLISYKPLIKKDILAVYREVYYILNKNIK